MFSFFLYIMKLYFGNSICYPDSNTDSWQWKPMPFSTQIKLSQGALVGYISYSHILTLMYELS